VNGNCYQNVQQIKLLKRLYGDKTAGFSCRLLKSLATTWR